MASEPVDESLLISALQRGDRTAFARLIDEHTPGLLSLADACAADHVIAEEVVAETWTALLRAISTFEKRSALRTWLFAMTITIAVARGIREHDEEAPMAPTGPTVDPGRFFGLDDPRAGAWAHPPAPFPERPEDSTLALALRGLAERGLETLPPGQREVVLLRDTLGLDSAEVCEVLAISPANQRALLHHGRATIRQILENYVCGIRDEDPRSAAGTPAARTE